MTFLLRLLVIGGFGLVLMAIGCYCMFCTRSYQQYIGRYYEAEAKRLPWLSFLIPSREFMNSRFVTLNTRICGVAAFIMGLIVFLLLFVKL